MVATVQNQMRENKKKTKILVSTFIIIITVVTFALSLIISKIYNDTTNWSNIFLSTIIALILASIYCAISYLQMTKLTMLNFNALEITEENDKELYDIVNEISIAAHLPMPKVFLISDDNSLNAFATGPNPKHSIVAVTNGLRQNMSRSQLEAVIGHEMSHILNGDTQISGLLIIMCSLIYLIGTYSFYFAINLGDDRDSRALSIPFFIVGLVLIIFAYPITKIIQYAISRQREYLADANSIRLTGNPDGLISAFNVLKGNSEESPYKKNSAQALFFNAPTMKKLFSTHPALDERINRINKLK